MKTYRIFLEKTELADSYVAVTKDGEWISFKIADCTQAIVLSFRTKKKYKKYYLKKLDKIYKALDIIKKEINDATD